MERREQFLPSQTQEESEQEQRVRLILRFIETRVIGKNETTGEEEETEIQKYYSGLTPREKADTLYSKVMAYMADRQAVEERKKSSTEELEAEKPDPYLVSEVKVLFSDPLVRELLPASYGEARVDAKKIRLSELGNLWEKTTTEIREKGKHYKQLERDLNLDKISGAGKISAARSRMARLAENLSALETRKKNMETLKGFPKIAENTDAVANFQYENLREYRRQLDTGFVWLPTPKAIHRKTISAILNHRWPVLIGEAGSGKSDLADAAGLELTGYLPTHIPCSSKTGEFDLIKDRTVASQVEGGQGYDEYKPLMQAFTGYEDSRQEKPSIPTGRLVRLDEAYRILHESSGYSILKEARQVQPGDLFYGKKVLPGAGAIWTTNPPGPRYPGRTAPDAAMRREVAEVQVPYPEMTIENPEIYEFALAALEDENYHIYAAREEMEPAYDKKDIPEDKREVLKDGSIIIAEDKIIKDMTDTRHGALWRFCVAIKNLQDGFVYGNMQTEEYPETLLRFKEDAGGNMEVTADGSGEPLTLSNSTVTLGELKSWMKGFNERRQKQDAEFRVDTLTEWINFKIKTYLEQADKADKEKLRAIFRHFGFLDKSVTPDLANSKPLTPKEIGYLSPRVPRPVYLERPVSTAPVEPQVPRPEEKELKEYETLEVLLDDGLKIFMKISQFTFEKGVFDLQTDQLSPLEVQIGRKFKSKGETFTFAGVVADENSPLNGQPIGQPGNGENLYRIFSDEDLNWGLEKEFKDLMGETGVDDMKDELLDCWDMEGCKETGEFDF